MAKQQNVLIDFEDRLNVLERILIKQRQEVNDFIKSAHKSKDTQKKLDQVANRENILGEVLTLALVNRDISIEFRAESRELLQRCRDLNQYTRDMFVALNRDLQERQRIEDKKKGDLVKDVTFLFGIPGGLITAVKNGVGDGLVTVTQAAIAGVTISISIVQRKRIGAGIVYLYKNSKTMPIVLDSRIAAKMIVEDSTEVAMRGKRAASKYLGWNGPK